MGELEDTSLRQIPRAPSINLVPPLDFLHHSRRWAVAAAEKPLNSNQDVPVSQVVLFAGTSAWSVPPAKQQLQHQKERPRGCHTSPCDLVQHGFLVRPRRSDLREQRPEVA